MFFLTYAITGNIVFSITSHQFAENCILRGKSGGFPWTVFDFTVFSFHSAYNAPSFRAGAQLLSSLSGYAYTKRAWKKDVLELFLDPTFFQMDTSCVQ
jgi:hypothetical protein